MADVGPMCVMPSGGLIAMGNVRNIARDVRSGLIGLTLAQLPVSAFGTGTVRRRQLRLATRLHA